MSAADKGLSWRRATTVAVCLIETTVSKSSLEIACCLSSSRRAPSSANNSKNMSDLKGPAGEKTTRRCVLRVLIIYLVNNDSTRVYEAVGTAA